MPGTSLLQRGAGWPDELGCCATELMAVSVAGSGHEYVPFASQSTGSIGDVLPVGEIVRRSLVQAEDALVRLQAYRAVRCGLAEVSNGRQT